MKADTSVKVSKGLMLLLIAAFAFGGCAKNRDLEMIAKEQAATIESLRNEIERLNDELDQSLRAKEGLAKAQAELESKLKDLMGSGDLSVSMQERGLVVTVLNEVLFDSGKAELKQTALKTLKTVGDVIQDKAGDHLVFVEGHTDNVPIKFSGWKSNWELSTGRATEVVHYFIDQIGLNPELFAATGYGEYHPVASNDAAQGRAQNRRVEIVISPKRMIKR